MLERGGFGSNGEVIGLDVKAMRTTRQADATRHLANSKELFLRLLDVVRGVDREWVRDLFGFAPIPHLVLYLKIDVATLIRRVIPRGVVDYFESGMDLALGDDPYDCFKQYQTLLIREYNKLATEFGFHVINGAMRPEKIEAKLRDIVTTFFAGRKFLDWPGQRKANLTEQFAPGVSEPAPSTVAPDPEPQAAAR